MCHTIALYHLGLVVWRPISANPRLNFIIGFYVSLLKSRFRIILPFSFLGHLIIKLKTKRVKLSFLFKLSDLKTSFILTVGYLNPALNNPALIMKELSMFVMFHGLAPASCMECFLSMFCDSSSPLKSCFFYRFSERNSNTLHHHLFLFLWQSYGRMISSQIKWVILIS